MSNDQYDYDFDYEPYDNYANLPNSTRHYHHHQVAAEPEYHEDFEVYQVNQLQSQQNYQPMQYDYQQQPQQQHHVPTTINSHNIVSVFTDLAKTVKVRLPKGLTKHILTLIRLGVPPDDIYLFLKECLESQNRV